MADRRESQSASSSQNRLRTLIEDKYGYGRGFEIAAGDGKFRWAPSSEGRPTILLSATMPISNRLTVRYDWSNTPDGNVYNKKAPALPFRRTHQSTKRRRHFARTYHFRRRRSDLDPCALLAQPGMSRRIRTAPELPVERIHTARRRRPRRQGFPANELCGTSDLQSDRIGRKGADVAELIGDPQYQRECNPRVASSWESSGVSTNCWSRPWPDHFGPMTCCADVPLDAQVSQFWRRSSATP